MTTQDPLADSYLSFSPYGYCSGNPVSRIDPSGMADDWVERLDTKLNRMRFAFDPNVTSAGDPDLKPLDRYMGESFQIHDQNGNVTADYRKDGSILFAREADAHRRIVEQSQSTGNEGFFAMTSQGNLVLPDYKNDATTVDPSDYGYKFVNGNIVDPFGSTYKTYGTVHTHLDGSEPSTWDQGSYGDLGFARTQTPNKPAYVLQLNGMNKVSFIVAHPNASLPRNHDTGRVTDKFHHINVISLMKGNSTLSEFTHWNAYYFKHF